MQSQLTCPLCDEIYQSDNLPRLLVGCGHTYCERCLVRMTTSKNGVYKVLCPEDEEVFQFSTNSLTNFPKNLALIKIMDSTKNNLSFKDSSLEMSKINKNASIQDDDDAQQLMDVIGITTQPLSQQKQKAQIEMCLLHKKPLQIACIVDLKKICVNCAIFGEHKGHDFKSLDQIEKQGMEYYTSILNVMDKKVGISQRLSNQQTCSEIMGILENKKQKVKQSITAQYKKLMDAIKLKEHQSLKDLDLIIDKAEEKAKGLMTINPQLMQKYMIWEDKSYEEIKILEGCDFEAKLQLMFAEITNNSVDVIEEGSKIVSDMARQEQNLIQEVQIALENIGVDCNHEIFNHVEGFVEVFDEIKKKKPKTRASTNSPKQNIHQVSFLKPKYVQETTMIPEDNQKYQNNGSNNISQDSKIEDDDQEDLLDYDEPSVKKPEFIKQQEDIKETGEALMNTVRASQAKQQKLVVPLIHQTSFNYEKKVRPNKKKLSKIRLPEKFEKMADALANDTVQLIDFTNAELGDLNVIIISQFLNDSKARTVKFIRNKISDETISKILPYMGSVITLNLSQNLLTDRALDILIEGRHEIQSMKSIILSQNKIVERKHKAKIQKLRGFGLTVSI